MEDPWLESSILWGTSFKLSLVQHDDDGTFILTHLFRSENPLSIQIILIVRDLPLNYFRSLGRRDNYFFWVNVLESPFNIRNGTEFIDWSGWNVDSYKFTRKEFFLFSSCVPFFPIHPLVLSYFFVCLPKGSFDYKYFHI